MLEMLQKDGGPDGTTSRAIWPTTLVLDNEYPEVAKMLLARAQREVRICAYAWRWYANEPELGIQELNKELFLLRDRGVEVRCLVDTETMRRTMEAQGFNARSVEATRMLHTKALCVDDDSLLIGSHNMTKRAITDNYECSVAVGEFEIVQQFITYFDAIWRARG